MILYCDTSALVKCYCREEGSDAVLDLRRKAEATAVSVVGYSELHSAINRKRRDGDLSARDAERILREFDVDWEGCIRVEITPGLNMIVARLLKTHPLRAFDALHLASALLLRTRMPQTYVSFSGFDDRQRMAAKRERLTVMPG
ncbi:MAG: type II toxin-antitoxin system VapC family toxin [Lentisphaerae bacterium]|nr:type II toxin-antitoxin system VapC family toxin [Lentisphaerota bacterium]